MTDLPAPFVPPDLDLTSLSYMPLVIARLKDSGLKRKASPAGFRAAVLLWMAAWHEIPAASLPNDEAEIRDIAGYGPGAEEAWAAIREEALRGFILCSDGRLYHAFLADRATEAGTKIRKNKNKTAAATAARQAKRNEQRNDVGGRDDERHDTDTKERDARNDAAPVVVTETKRSEVKGSEEKKEPSHSPPPVPREAGLGLEWEVIEARLRAAADWQKEPAPGLCVVGPIIALIEAGADLELDILPTVRALAPKCRIRTSWKFFLEAIKEARDLRLSMAGPSARAPGDKPANGVMTETEAAAFLDAHNAKIKSGAAHG